MLTLDQDSTEALSDEQLKLVKALWADASLQKCYERRREYQLTDSAK